MEIESRLLPCGLHVVGSPPSAAEAVATLVNIAEIDRPDNDPPVAGLPGILARAIGRNMEEIYLNNNKVRPGRAISASCLNMHKVCGLACAHQKFARHEGMHCHGPCMGTVCGSCSGLIRQR